MKKNSRNQQINKLRKETENFKGVHLDVTKVANKSTGIFRSRLTNLGVTYSLGYHATAIDAAKAFNKKAKSLFRSEKAAKAAGKWNTI